MTPGRPSPDTDLSLESDGDGLSDHDVLDLDFSDDIFDQDSENSTWLYDGTNPFNDTLLPDGTIDTSVSSNCWYGPVSRTKMSLPAWDAWNPWRKTYNQVARMIWAQSSMGMCDSNTTAHFKWPDPFFSLTVSFTSPSRYPPDCSSTARQITITRSLARIIDGVRAVKRGAACCVLRHGRTGTWQGRVQLAMWMNSYPACPPVVFYERPW